MMAIGKREQSAMLIHDLRSPLATVHGYTQLLLRHARSQDSQRLDLEEGLRQIQDAATRLDRLLDELAAEHGSQTDDYDHALPRMTDLVQLAYRLAAQAQPLAGSTTRIIVLPAVSALVGDWDPVGLERVFANLIDNALKYSAADRPVVVSVTTNAGWAVISVADQGIGIPPADISRVFETGYRAANGRPTASGQGLGLGAVRSIIQSQGGTVSVASEEGVGTTVLVRLPLRQAATRSLAFASKAEV